MKTKIKSAPASTSKTPVAQPPGAKAAKPKPLIPVRLKKILVPADFSEESRKALHYAIALASQFGASITLLYVFEPVPYPADLGYGPAMLAVSNQDWEAKALPKLKLMARPAIRAQVPVELKIITGTAHHEITTAAQTAKVDLIIMGTHGYSGFAHAMLGSTAEKVVRHAACPVMVVRAHEHEFA